MKEKIAIGFDLGTTSVGWSVIKIDDKNPNERLKILDMGVRLFDDPASSDNNNESRRVARGRRRRINRLKVRKHDLYKLLKKFNIVKDEDEFKTHITKPIYDSNEECYKLPVEIKIKGLESELSKHELVLILHSYIKHRGSLNTIDLSEEEEEKEKSKKPNNNIYDSNLYPCQNQYNWFKVTGKIIGNTGNYLISNDNFKKEIIKILSNQKHLIDDNFISQYIKLFERHRHYSEGPGSENSPTEYGRFKKDEFGNLVWQGNNSNLWDLKIGKCTYYPNEVRNYKRSPITEIFNLLNDLANMKIMNNDDNNDKGDSEPRFLTLEERKKILSLPYDKLTLDKITKSIGYKKENIVSGLKKDTKDKFVIEELKSTKALLKWIAENNINKSIDLGNLDDLKFIDNIYQQGVRYQNFNERNHNLKENRTELNINLDDEQIEKLAALKIYNSGTSSLSSKAQIDFIKFSLSSNDSNGKNQMVYFTESDTFKNNQIDKFSKFKYFPENFFKDEIMPLTVKRTFNQTIKVLNGILKQYSKNYELSHIIIELARELNSKEEADKITRELNKNKKHLEERLKFHGISEEDIKKGENRLKFLLWDQQCKEDIYDGELIDLKHLLSNPNSYHIDHVLPISISFNDSMQNKVLTKAINNEKKGDKTPYQWLSSIGEYKEYEDRCKRYLNDMPDKKLKSKFQNKLDNYLLYKKDPFSELKGFVERQLNDTRYISREISNQLKLFFKQSNEWKNSKIIISPVNGAITNFARNNLFKEEDSSKRLIFKNRDIYNHHAIDASIIAYLGLNHKIQNLLKIKSENIVKSNVNGAEVWIDKETGVWYAEKSDFLKEEALNAKYFRDQMINYLDNNIKNINIKFSRMILSKNNMKLSDETLYSSREINNKFFKITKLKLLNNDVKNLNNYFGTSPKYISKLLIYDNEPLLFKELNKIYIEYSNKIITEKLSISTNPFHLYINSELVQSRVKKIMNNDKFNFDIIDKIPIFNNDFTKIINWIREVKIKDSEVNLDGKIITKFTKSKKLNKKPRIPFLDSVNSLEFWVYKNNINKWEVIFINALNSTWKKSAEGYGGKMEVDKEKLNNYLSKFNINQGTKAIKLKRGTTLIKNNDLYYVVGGVWSQKLIEIKALSCKNEIAYKILNWKEAPQRNQWQISLSKIVNEFKLCKVDVLGNIYDVKSFDEYFDNN
ncbi:MAG: type II CRISPR RNA-guided endonuclease Cas9 [Mycoplasma sp.]|nr:type II CRISPR RNA-guided endonuclease Cas9 [Mycoplasma sp.]